MGSIVRSLSTQEIAQAQQQAQQIANSSKLVVQPNQFVFVAGFERYEMKKIFYAFTHILLVAVIVAIAGCGSLSSDKKNRPWI